MEGSMLQWIYCFYIFLSSLANAFEGFDLHLEQALKGFLGRTVWGY